MLNLDVTHNSVRFWPGAVVAPADDLGGIQSPDGTMVARERLGPGIVEEAEREGMLRVRWIDAGLDCVVNSGDVRTLGSYAHLIKITRRDKHGHMRAAGRRVVEGAGLEHNWSVDLLPGNIIRVERQDGAAWTFLFNWVFGRVIAHWNQPPDDEDAEAFAVAEIATRRRRGLLPMT